MPFVKVKLSFNVMQFGIVVERFSFQWWMVGKRAKDVDKAQYWFYWVRRVTNKVKSFFRNFKTTQSFIYFILFFINYSKLTECKINCIRDSHFLNKCLNRVTAKIRKNRNYDSIHILSFVDHCNCCYHIQNMNLGLHYLYFDDEIYQISNCIFKLFSELR